MLRSQDKDALMASSCLSDELTCIEIISTFGVSAQDNEPIGPLCTNEDDGSSAYAKRQLLHLKRKAGSLPVLLFAGVIADTLGVETVMYVLAAAILRFSWWAARYSHCSVVS
jgi:hypothetical protein